MTNSSVGNLMYAGVRTFGWIFWLWWRIKQKIGRGKKMNKIDRVIEKLVHSKFKTVLSDIKSIL